MESKVKIRRMEAGDRDEVLAMMRVFYDSPAVFHTSSDRVLENDFDACVGNSPFLDGYVFDDAGKAAGYAMVSTAYTTEYGGLCGWVEDLYLKPGYRGSGLARQFFESLQELYPDAVRFKLEVEPENDKAVRAYEGCGWSKLPYYVFESVVREGGEDGGEGFRKMRRIKQELSKDWTEIIFKNGTSGVLAVMGDGGYPYAVPVSYVYEDGCIYFHSALSGHKVDALKKNDKVSFCVIARDEVIPEKVTTHYASAVAFGRAEFLQGDEKLKAALLLADKYSRDYPEAVKDDIDRNYSRMNMIRIAVEHMTGKAGREIVNEYGDGGQE